MQTGFVAPSRSRDPVARKMRPTSIGWRARCGARAGPSSGSSRPIGRASDWTTFFDFIITGAASDRFRLAFAEGQPEHAQLWRELDRRANDLLVSKNRLTPFADPWRELETRLRARGLEMALIVGTVTNVCCECTARDAAMRNFKTIMISDANASRNDAEHNATLSISLQAFGGVLSTNEAIALIDGASVE